MDVATFILLAKTCAPAVNIRTARALVAVESNFNPYAIGVVGGALTRQPQTLNEALATITALKRAGWNFSVGLGQINARNFVRYGVDERAALDACANLQVMQSILSECFARASQVTETAQRALRYALSCYYAGNFQSGFTHGYVRRIENAARDATQE